MQPSGVITITTDFGHKGPFAAVMHGVIIKRFPDARVIDLAHDIPAQWPPEAGFWVSRSYQYFPRGTVHLAIVDPGVGTERDILIVEYDDHFFMAPDNGLLARMLDKADDASVFKLRPDALESLDIRAPSMTFHGRDIFAPVAAELAAGRTTPADIGLATTDWTPAWLDEPEVTASKVSGVIVTVDAFGNLISNIDAELIEEFSNPVAHIAGHDIEMRATYGRAKPGDYLALINSFGVLEVAKAESSAAEGLGSDRGAPITVVDGLAT
ncbi:MAG: SAM-dependent chlorinase/fluorinase [Gammaproteobacteria bacterium]|jgi:S-adenosylmethionine hydrolase|nr:SAM-dependent chlorinase/fluorinase [Gammaproteobacteria bacterium]MDH3751363.1 SAM-dependent chlorinase/fluorinase [Gammaproteobacteria bacterium]MDH3804626.1 SAM-dependent chlorinase/fluorinase [Gammaproteobacteria bacterium]